VGGGEVGDVSAKLLHRCGRLNLHRKWSRSFAKTLDLVHFSPEVRAIRNTQHFANGRVPLLCTFGLSEPAPRFYLADQVQTVTTYFGSDQPHITIEVALPWRALGVTQPTSQGHLRMEIAATARHRSRWMSWGGLPPVQSMQNPSRWRLVGLAGN
jgi:hypothetical protein